MELLTTFAQIVGYGLLGLFVLACLVTPIVIFASVKHKHISETELSKWDKKHSL